MLLCLLNTVFGVYMLVFNIVTANPFNYHVIIVATFNFGFYD